MSLSTLKQKVKVTVTLRQQDVPAAPSNFLRTPIAAVMAAAVATTVTPGALPLVLADDDLCEQLATVDKGYAQIKCFVNKAATAGFVTESSKARYLRYRKHGGAADRKGTAHVHTAMVRMRKEHQQAQYKARLAKAMVSAKAKSATEAKARSDEEALRQQKRKAKTDANYDKHVTDTKRSRRPAHSRSIVTGSTIQVVHGEDDRETWKWESLPHGMASEIELRLEAELDRARGLSDTDLKQIRGANELFDLVVKQKGIDEFGDNVLEMYLEEQWRIDQGYKCTGQDASHIFAHSSGGAFSRWNLAGFCSHWNRFYGSDHDILCVYTVGLFRAQLAYRVSKYQSEMRERDDASACPRKGCECSAWQDGPGVQRPFTPIWEDVGNMYILGRDLMNQLRAPVMRTMSDIKALRMLKAHKK